MNRFLLTCFCLAASLLVASAGVAANITIADVATFDADVTITGVNTFAGLVPALTGYDTIGTYAIGNTVDNPTGAANDTLVTLTGASVTADGIALNLTPDNPHRSPVITTWIDYMVNNTSGGWGNLANSGLMVVWPGSATSTAIIPPSGTTALAVDLYAAGKGTGGSGLDAYAEVFFSDATTEDVSIPYGSTELPGSFLGVATTTPGVTISSVVFPLSQDLAPAFTNIRVGTYNVSNVPEPSTLALLATGVAGLLAFAWRKRK